MTECTVSTPPTVEDGCVVFTVVHNDSGRVFRCVMSGPTSVEVTPLPRDVTPWAEGEARALVAEHALDYERDNPELFRQLFDQIAAERAAVDELE